MNFNEYQVEAEKTAHLSNTGLPPYIYLLLGLAGESGEVVEKFKKMIRNENGVISPEFKESVKRELGDVLWYLAVLAKTLDFSLEDVAVANIEKVRDREARGVIKSQGDTR